MIRSRRWVLGSFGSLLFGALLVPSIASAKKKKKAAATPSAQADTAGMNDAHLSKHKDGRWYLKNQSQAQRLIVTLRYKPPGSAPTYIDAFSLEPGQEVSVPLPGNGTTVSVSGARYD